MKKKILHIAQCNGGVSEYLKMFFKYSDTNEFKNIFIGSQVYAEEKEIFEKITEKSYWINMYREINIKKDFRSITQIQKIIKEEKPDIIYAHSSKAGALARVANLKFKIPCIYNPHGWAFNMKTSYKKHLVYKYIEKILGKFTTKIVAISEFEKISALHEHVCKENKIDIIWNGIDFGRVDKEFDSKLLKKKLNIPENAYIVGMVGRISEQKAPDTFVKVARKVKDKIPNAHFIIVGDGNEREKIEELIKKENLDECFTITGWVNSTFQYINLFDVATLMSRWEGFGLVIAEYMIMKKPIVCTEVNALPNLIQNDINGCLAKVDDINELMKNILKISFDDKFRNEIVEKSYEKVIENFNIQNTVKYHEELFRKVMRS